MRIYKIMPGTTIWPYYMINNVLRIAGKSKYSVETTVTWHFSEKEIVDMSSLMNDSGYDIDKSGMFMVIKLDPPYSDAEFPHVNCFGIRTKDVILPVQKEWDLGI